MSSELVRVSVLVPADKQDALMQWLAENRGTDVTGIEVYPDFATPFNQWEKYRGVSVVHVWRACRLDGTPFIQVMTEMAADKINLHEGQASKFLPDQDNLDELGSPPNWASQGFKLLRSGGIHSTVLLRGLTDDELLKLPKMGQEVVKLLRDRLRRAK